MQRDSREVGIIVGSTNTSKFYFVIKDDLPVKPKIGDIVKTKGYNETIYGIITDIEIRAPDPLEIARDYKALEYFSERLGFTNILEIAEVKILGAVGENEIGLHRPVFPPRPNEKVYLPSEEELEEKIYGSRTEFHTHLGTIRSLGLRPKLKLKELIIKHTAIFGVTGAGKSHTVAVLAYRLSKHNGIPVVIFDVHRDYVRAFDNAKIITFTKRHGLSGENVYLAKIKISEIKDELFDILHISFNRTAVMYSILHELLFTEKRQSGAEIETIEELRDKVKKYLDRVRGKNNENSVRSLLRRLERLRSMTIFFKNSEELASGEFVSLDQLLRLAEKSESEEQSEEEVPESELAELDKQMDPEMLKKVKAAKLAKRGALEPGSITIIDLFPLSYQEQEIVIYVTLRKIFRLWKERKENGEPVIPLVVILEEAHRYATSSSYAESVLSTIAREGRKFGLGLWIVSQIPNKISEGIISQINTFILHKLINPKDISFLKASCPYLSEEYFHALTQLERGEAIVVGLGIEQPAILKVDTTPEEGKQLVLGGSEEDIERALKLLRAKAKRS